MLDESNISTVEFKPNPKKDFLFTWSLGSLMDNPYLKSVKSNDSAYYTNYESIFKNVDYNYISQLAQKVSPPTQELDGDTDVYGEVDVYVPIREKYNNIQVTYLDDELETVYIFHSKWLTLIRRHYHPIYVYGAHAYYHTYTFGFSKSTDPKTSTLSNPKITQTLRNEYPLIVPMSIERTPADKGGNGLGGVTVSYKQLIVPYSGDLINKIKVK